LTNIKAAHANWRGPRLLKYIEAFTPDGDENRRIQGNGCLIRSDEAGFAKKRWLIAPKERSVGACPNMRDSSCCKLVQAADHDHALAA
jgi:hypothetical protein